MNTEVVCKPPASTRPVHLHDDWMIYSRCFLSSPFVCSSSAIWVFLITVLVLSQNNHSFSCHCFFSHLISSNLNKATRLRKKKPNVQELYLPRKTFFCCSVPRKLEEGSKVIQEGIANRAESIDVVMEAGRRRWGSVSWQAVRVQSLTCGRRNRICWTMTEPGWNVKVTMRWLLAHGGHVSFAVKGVIKALIATITIVLFLRVPQRMMQENSLIFASTVRKFSGFWASKGMGSYWAKSSLARVKACWHIVDLQETLWTSSVNKSMVKPLPPSFHSCGTWGWSKLQKAYRCNHLSPLASITLSS